MHSLYKFFVGTLVVFVLAISPALAQEPDKPDATPSTVIPSSPNSSANLGAAKVGANTPGDELGEVTLPGNVDGGFNCAVSGSFDGTYYSAIFDDSNCASTTLQIYDPPADGDGSATLVSEKDIVDPDGNPVEVSALEWDPTRGKYWAAYDGNTYLIDRGDPTDGEEDAVATFQFDSSVAHGFSVTDGLAYDGSDDTIWYTSDVSDDVYHFDVDGTVLGSITPETDADGNQNGNISGAAVGAVKNDRPTLYLGRAGDGEIIRVYADDGEFISIFAENVSERVEALSCDPNTYDNEGLLAKDGRNEFYTAFEVEEGTCPLSGVDVEIGLAPTSATNPVGTDHTVTATVQNGAGDPLEGRDVAFEIMSGPNAGMTGSGTTDSNGEATFTWSSSATGTDIVIAETSGVTSNEAEKTWTAAGECDVPTLGEDNIDQENRTLSNTMQDDEGIAEFTFTLLENFTVASINPSSGFDRSGNTWTWTGAGDPPTSVDFMLEAGPDNTSTYFLEVTDNCDDPNTVTFDPSYEFGPASTKAQLVGNAPNPFSGQTTIEFALPEQTRVTVAVYDMMGRKVATLVDGVHSAGPHEITWNGQSDSGQDLASGVYLLRMQASGQSSTRRVTIVR